MSDTDTSITTETDTEIPTWLFAILFPFGWSVGNSYAEALDNAVGLGGGIALQSKDDPHMLVAFSVPVQHVKASMFGLEWQWTDKNGGVAIEIPMNGYGEES